MYLSYVDESGDDGVSKTKKYKKCATPTQFFIRSAMIIHDKKWKRNNENIINYRFANEIPNPIEIHASEIYRGKSKYNVNNKRKEKVNWWGKRNPDKKERITTIKNICALINKLDITIIFVAIDKKKLNCKINVKEKSWELLIERVNLFLSQQKDKCGMIISDAIENKIEKDHREFIKTMYNYSDHINSKYFIESILFEPSESSNFLQVVDIASYAFHRKLNCRDNQYFSILESKVFEHNSSITRNSGMKIWPD